ncbi:MAG: tripartite tricarboxylate transporter TctB family protein [Rhodospirillaceae bacterium]|nr:tripartite tricarboxylate transporter TctB family protein [Rhodospirillaceae bacterium]
MHVVKRIDFWSGLGFLILGAWAFMTARGFDATSSTYPMFLAAILFGLAALLIVQSVRDPDAKTVHPESTRILLLGPGMRIVAWGGWAVALAAGGGYLLPSIVVFALIAAWVAPVRKDWRHLLVAVGLVLVVFFMFYVVFDVPLPIVDALQDLLD